MVVHGVFVPGVLVQAKSLALHNMMDRGDTSCVTAVLTSIDHDPMIIGVWMAKMFAAIFHEIRYSLNEHPVEADPNNPPGRSKIRHESESSFNALLEKVKWLVLEDYCFESVLYSIPKVRIFVYIRFDSVY
ncbi:AAEL001927-PA [Aedes aegypti]|uniref:AAEL001927-PA n=1 Tax=Aedes aegypti TaxID=7159 RepID=Q17JQ9_AEDAE|nr:AAEL001927-PA [Aedes aegypti]